MNWKCEIRSGNSLHAKIQMTFPNCADINLCVFRVELKYSVTKYDTPVNKLFDSYANNKSRKKSRKMKYSNFKGHG